MESYSKRQRAEGRGQKVYYWYVVVSAPKSVLTFMATAIPNCLKTDGAANYRVDGLVQN